MSFSGSTRSSVLESRAVGSLPIINHVLEALEVDALFTKYAPGDTRSKVAPAVGLGVILRNLLVAREPLYGMQEWSRRCEAGMLGLEEGAINALNDDRLGRCLDKLFEADRAGLMTELMMGAVRGFGISMEELHNDSTTVTFEGDYAGAKGQKEKGHRTARITYGHNKDHRPDLKQLLYNLTTSADGSVPVWCSIKDGNTTDDQTHIENWNTLCRLSGSPGFLYVADSKLCTRSNMDHIHRRGGRFVTILPRSRGEVDWFRTWKEKNEPQWTELLRQPNSRAKDGPDEVYSAIESPLPSGEGFRIVWVHSSQKQERDMLTRQRRVSRATDLLAALAAKLQGPRTRLRSPEAIKQAVDRILGTTQTAGLINAAVETRDEETFKQAGPGRPTKDTAYVCVPRVTRVLHWSINADAVEADAKMDGIFPLITNDRKLSAGQVLAAYKHQPALERRHEQLKTVLEVMPVFLKNSTRVEALLFLYFMAVLVHALLERQLRARMREEGIAQLPVYPEDRGSRRPTTDQVFRIFEDLRIHFLKTPSGTCREVFTDELTARQREFLRLLNIPAPTYFSRHASAKT